MLRRDLLLLGGGLLLLVVAVVRVASPDRLHLRPLSIEGVHLDLGRIEPGQTVVKEINWDPPDDVYLLGWNAWFSAPEGSFNLEMMLYDAGAKTAIFVMDRGNAATPPDGLWRTNMLPAGTGFRAMRGHPLRFRCQVGNSGSRTLETRGATALLYFVPMEGN
jgi:hypothetical protein